MSHELGDTQHPGADVQSSPNFIGVWQGQTIPFGPQKIVPVGEGEGEGEGLAAHTPFTQ